jgi:hypothetical protein
MRKYLSKAGSCVGLIHFCYFHPYAQIVDAGLISAGLACYRVLVEIRCRFKRQFMVMSF